MLKRLINTGLIINIYKYTFNVIKTHYFGLIIFINNIEINPDKVLIIY